MAPVLALTGFGLKIGVSYFRDRQSLLKKASIFGDIFPCPVNRPPDSSAQKKERLERNLHSANRQYELAQCTIKEFKDQTFDSKVGAHIILRTPGLNPLKPSKWLKKKLTHPLPTTLVGLLALRRQLRTQGLQNRMRAKIAQDNLLDG